ncbi:hydroxyisourate hydrolase [Aeromicrobium sp.]|uniref:hydroxyisourate hydrolase n=1 Tax=Aeromicrobium sp. TaxID=1871063 RepID=UPI0030C27B1A
MGTLSTHVLDTSVGLPAPGIPVTLSVLGKHELGSGTTDDDGRIGSIGPEVLEPGDYALRFDIAAYFTDAGRECFYPEIVVAFTIPAGGGHFHVPVLLNPYGYSTYRGS